MAAKGAVVILTTLVILTAPDVLKVFLSAVKKRVSLLY
jgi:hypothetical protein